MGALRLHGRVLAVLLALGAALARSSAGRSSSRLHVVRIKDIAFHPARLVVHRGDRVQWRWQDAGVPHNVTSSGTHRFRGAGTRSSGRYGVPFSRAGTYRYHCTIHFGMTGVVVVR